MGGEEERMKLAYGVVRDEIPTRIVVVEDDGTDGERVTGARRGQNPILPRWSPDGERIAFVRSNPAGGPSAFRTYVVNADGSGERSVGEGTQPRWTKDGAFLVVERPRLPPKNSTLHVVPVSGGEGRALTEGTNAVVSNDGTRVAFVRQTFGPRVDKNYPVETSFLYTIGLDGTGLRKVAEIKGPTFFRQPQWLPGDRGIAVIERQGGLAGPLVTYSEAGARDVVVPKVGETYDWSPLDDLVSYTEGGLIFIVRPDGTEVDSYGQSNAIDIGWSPDGKKVAFSVQEVVDTEAEFIGIYTIDVEKQERRRIVFTDGFVAYFDWQPLPPEDEG
jgi:Tol biopolymer transport system component